MLFEQDTNKFVWPAGTVKTGSVGKKFWEINSSQMRKKYRRRARRGPGTPDEWMRSCCEKIEYFLQTWFQHQQPRGTDAGTGLPRPPRSPLTNLVYDSCVYDCMMFHRGNASNQDTMSPHTISPMPKTNPSNCPRIIAIVGTTSKCSVQFITIARGGGKGTRKKSSKSFNSTDNASKTHKNELSCIISSHTRPSSHSRLPHFHRVVHLPPIPPTGPHGPPPPHSRAASRCLATNSCAKHIKMPNT